MAWLEMLEKTGLVTIEKDENPVKDTKTVKPSTVSVNTPLSNTVYSYPNPSITDGSVDDGMVKKLKSSFINDPVLVDFNNLKVAMKAAIPDEKIMISAVLAALQAKGIEKATILASFQNAQSILELQKNNFNSSIEKLKSDKTSEAEKNIESNNKQADQLVLQIQEITAKINELHDKNSVLTNSIQDIQIQLSENTNKFQNSYNLVLNELIQDLQKLN